MPQCYIIMGESRVKKSSTIRALTGAYRSNPYYVAIKDADPIKIFVQIPSLQETKKKLRPKDFINRIKKEKCDYVLVSLRINKVPHDPHDRPVGNDYIQSFLNEGWNIESVVILNEEEVPRGYPGSAPRPILIKNTKNGLPANKIASKLRKQWNWY